MEIDLYKNRNTSRYQLQLAELRPPGAIYGAQSTNAEDTAYLHH